MENKSFITETTKEKPVNKKKLMKRTMTTAGLAVMFGLIACLTFVLLEPVINYFLNPMEVEKVEFPEEEREVKPEELLTDKVLEKEKIEDEESRVDFVKKRQLFETYENTYSQFQNLAKEFEKSIVSVIGISEKNDWLTGTTENENITTGLIIAENGLEVLILADVRNMNNVKEHYVKFSSKQTVEVTLKEEDSQTGLGIYAAKISDLGKATLRNMQIARLGSSMSENLVGSPAIVVGAPYAAMGSLAYGMITDASKRSYQTDAIYSILTTDMNMDQNASGVIINLRGEVLGFVSQSANDSKDTGTIKALGISDIKTLITKLSNNESRAYVGIKPMDVTQEAHQELSIPYGVYVSEVITDSPAMMAGVQNGDVIIRIAKKDITSFQEFRAALATVKPGNEISLGIKRYNGKEYKDIEINVMTREVK